MSEETTVQTAVEEQTQQVPNPFAEQSWSTTPVKAEETTVQKDTTTQQTQATTTDEEEEIIDANEYLKNRLGFDDWETAEQEIQKLKEKTSTEFKFENDLSKKAFDYLKENKEDELLSFLQEKKKVERLVNAEVKDAKVAEEIIKLSMYQNNKELDADEINFLFNEKYSIPQKPEQGFDQTDEEYAQAISNWESRVNEVQKKMVIEAKMAKPELEKLKGTLVLPDIAPSNQDNGISQEELEKYQQSVESFKGQIDGTLKSFDGIQVSVKDEGVDFNVAYTPSQEEKEIIKQQLNDFAENGLNANIIFAQRWVNDDGTINVRQINDDLFTLNNKDKIFQKAVNDAANKRLALHLKQQSNITLNGNQSQGTFTPDNQQSEMDKMAAVFFAK